nr:putative disease resistance protein At3g14460 [Arachis hypogaea]
MASKLEGGAYLSSFVDAISKKLSSILEDDSVLEGNDSVLELLERLDEILCDVEHVLDDAELKQFRNDRVKKWLVDLQDALYMADDFLDELSTKAAIATPGRKGKLGLEKSAKLDTSWRIPSTSLVVSSDIVGRDEDKENIIKLLLDDTCDAESHVTVIPIVGMGGIGKTTLAQLVYNDAKIMGKFDTRVWVCVAENPNPVHVTRTIIGAIDSSPCNRDNFDSLQTDLKKKLTGKTFIVVLDDVWDEQRNMWENFLKPFHYGNNGSKILLTTRSGNVASVFAPNSLHCRLSLLSEEDCWKVFLKHSSISTGSKQYAILEPIGRKIVEKCKGLPLAVKTLGGLLRNKYNEGDWENVLDSKIWELSEDVSPALRVSYHYLPSHLKRCFVYCSLYPEDYQFDKDKLILLWMAEDLLQPKENNTLENIGCAYFDELVARSFFQPVSTNRKLFIMHDLMRDLATFFAGKFYFKLKEFGNRCMIDNKTRHLSYVTKFEDSIKLFREAYNGAVHLRTFLDFTLLRRRQSIDIESDSWLLQQQLGCLRVLSFKRSSIESLPDSIGELILVRYLNLSYAPIVTLPESICKLYNLQTLKLKNCAWLKMLPSRMEDLVNMRHLDIRGTSRLKEMPKGMSKLKYLNFLSDYIIGKHEENGIRELGTLDNLHGSFCISKLENVKNSGEVLKAKMGNKKHINTLELNWLPDGDIDDVQTERDILGKLQPHQNLKKLSIVGYRGETFPDWLGLSCYSHMTKLSLDRCMNCCKLPSLGQLPSLQHLKFSNLDGLEKIDLEFYNKSNASFQQETPFKCLETLKIVNMYSWREWHFPYEFDGFPKLRILSIKSCPVLKGGLPAHLPALEKLEIVECEELACRLPRAPKLHQLLVEGSSTSYWGVAPHNIVISGTQLANSVLEWLLLHIQLPRVIGLRIINYESAISISGDYLPASLQYLEISSCSKLTFSEHVQHKSLTKIEVKGCGSLTLFPMAGFPNLTELEISECQSMEKFHVGVPQALPNLLCLRISKCPSLVSLPSLGLAAPHLQELCIEDCRKIDCFAEECLPPSFKTLEVIECEKLASWITSNVLQSECLTHLKLVSCFDTKPFPGEGCLPASLECLILREFPNLETLDCKGLHHLTSLKTLAIADCEKLENITEKHRLASIKNISIGEECPLRRKLEKMEHPRIQFIPYAQCVLLTSRYYGYTQSEYDDFSDTHSATCSVQ